VTLLGRTYHYLMKCGDFTRNGLKYFTYDALHAKTALNEHAEALNQIEERCNINYLHSIYDELTEVNELVHDCQQIGYFAQQYAINHESFFSEEAIMEINEYTSGLDIAAITADNITGNQVIHYAIKGQSQRTTISCYSNLQEPLLYPLLFPGIIFCVIFIYYIKGFYNRW
jgi:esterase/lipase superfamily enzyme